MGSRASERRRGGAAWTSYQLTVEPVADFTAGYDSSVWPPIWEDFHCDWRELWFNQRIEPPSWIAGDTVIEAGGKGILFPSQARAGGANLVVFVNALTATDSLQVYDPGQSLPRNQASWSG
jgi:RES domain-containing protein